jgi:hypothetical protein
MHTSTPRERELADCYADGDELAKLYAQMLADYREEILRPFDELRRDMAALGDERVARELDALIRTARGVP